MKHFLSISNFIALDILSKARLITLKNKHSERNGLSDCEAVTKSNLEKFHLASFSANSVHLSRHLHVIV